VKYFACPVGKGGAEINANAFHGCIRAHVAPAPLYLASATSGKDSREFFRRVNSEDSEDVSSIHYMCSAQRESTVNDVDVDVDIVVSRCFGEM